MLNQTSTTNTAGTAARRLFVGALLLLAGLAVLACGVRWFSASDRIKAPGAEAQALNDQSAAAAGIKREIPDMRRPAQGAPANTPTGSQTRPGLVLPEATPLARQALNDLILNLQDGQLATPEQVADWKEKLHRFIELGPEAVPAIVDYLRQEKDVVIGSDASRELGYSTARRAMIDALEQIGGPEGIAGTLQILRVTAVPQEVALLSRNLETMAPGEFRQDITRTVRDMLAMAASGKLDGFDVGPLFEVLQNYGDAGVLPDLEKAKDQWRYYSAMTMVNLPDGVGIPDLIRMTQEENDGALCALEMLAQASAKYPAARAVLLEQARANRISSDTWLYLIEPLSGVAYHFQDSATDPGSANPSAVKTSHIESGNQNFFTAPDTRLTAEQIRERADFIDELRSATSDPAAQSALAEAQNQLSTLLSSVSAIQH